MCIINWGKQTYATNKCWHSILQRRTCISHRTTVACLITSSLNHNNTPQSTGTGIYSGPKPYHYFSWYSSQCKMLYHFKPLQTDLKYHLICMHQDALFQYEMPIFAVHWGKKIIIFSLPEVFYDLKYAKNVFVARATPRTQLRELTTLRRP